MKRLIGLFAVALLLLGCAGFGGTSLKDLNDNPDEYTGKAITVSGTVENTIKLGKLSGYKLTQGNQSITVSSQSLPAEGKEITVKGVWTRDSLFGYYLLAEEE